MDPSLRLLARLQRRGKFRRWKKSLASPKGIVLAVITSLLFAWWVGSLSFAMTMGVKAPPESVRRQGPLVLLGFALLTLMVGNGGRALYFAPAEEAFLFAGPFHRRQLLAYKLRALAVGCLLSSVLMTMAFAMTWTSPVAGYVGSLLASLFLELLAVVVGLAGGVVGALARSRARRGAIAILAAALAWGAWSAGLGLAALPWREAVARVAESPALGLILAPFRVFVGAYAAERAWPDLAVWAAAGLTIDLALVSLVFALDAGYLEVASASSARTYAKLRRMRAGGGSLRVTSGRKAGRASIKLPPPPWWGGVGPNFWRQMTTALGSPGRVAMLVLIQASPLIGVLAAGQKGLRPEMTGFALAIIVWMSLFLTTLVPYDFRGDVDQMETLKALPIAPTWLALGQLLAPVLVTTFAQAVVMVFLLVRGGAPGALAWAGLAFLVPLNLLLIAVDNLLFLWYPTRMMVGQFDLAAIARQVLLMIAKVLGVGLGAGAAALAGSAAFFLAGRSLPVATVASWVVLVAAGLALVPWVGRAFADFDVAGDTPA